MVPRQDIQQPRMNNKLKAMSIETLNVRRLYATGAMKIVTSTIEKYKINIVAILELRWTGVGNIKLRDSSIFYSCGDKHEYGMGFVVKYMKP